MTTPAQPLKRGRPKKDTDTSAKLVRIYASVTTEQRDHMIRTYGSVWAAVRKMAEKELAAKKSTK